jgi:hypothetical protein
MRWLLTCSCHSTRIIVVINRVYVEAHDGLNSTWFITLDSFASFKNLMFQTFVQFRSCLHIPNTFQHTILRPDRFSQQFNIQRRCDRNRSLKRSTETKVNARYMLEQARGSVVDWDSALQSGWLQAQFPMRSFILSINLTLSSALWPWDRLIL